MLLAATLVALAREAAAVAAGVSVGLVVGKTIGVAGATWIGVRVGLGRLPDGATWLMVVGLAALAGVGFTVSLFIAELAYPGGPLQDAARVGILTGSLLAAVAGWAALRRACRPSSAKVLY